MFYTSLVLIHAATLAAASVLLVAGELLLLVARSGRVGPARTAFLASRLGGPIACVGVVTGIFMSWLGGWSLWTPWLLISLALVAVMALAERRLVRPWQALSEPVLRRDVAGPGIQAMATDPEGLVGRMLVMGLFGTIGALMIAKPHLAVPGVFPC